MPRPNKGENKHDFLKRCTAAVMAQEGTGADKAFGRCNAAWDDFQSQRSAMVLSAPLELAPAIDGETQPRPFLITAYTGAEVASWYGRLVIDVSGIKAAAKMPILREHLRDRVVGYSIKAWKDKQNFLIQGDFSQKTKDGLEVYDLAVEGFPWQASIGVWPEKVEVLQSDKDTAKVNGRTVVGPLEIWRETTVREVSFCALGADSEAAAIGLVDEDQEKVPVIIKRAQIKEEVKMEITVQLLEEQAPGLLKEIRAAAQLQVTLGALLERQPAEAEKLRAEGETRERTRVMDILDANGDPAVTLEAIKTGATPAETFKLLFRAEKDGRAAALVEMKKAAPAPLGQPLPAGAGGENYETKVQQLVDGQKLTRSRAIQQVAREFPALHQAYIARVNQAKSQ